MQGHSNINFKTADSDDYSEGNWHPKYTLDLRSFVFKKLPEDGTLVPKHVGVGT